MKACTTRGCTGHAVIKGECRACYVYRRRHGGLSRAELLRKRQARSDAVPAPIRSAIRATEQAHLRALVRAINGGPL